MGRATVVTAVLIGAALLAPAATGALISQGGVRMGADALWSRGLLGQGQTVAVLDEGFSGLDRSIALGELPPREAMTIRSFDPEGGLEGRTEFGLPTQHGVRMAELIHDLAPEARLVLVGYRTIDQFEEAAAWIASEGIPIVSHSNSFLTPPFDGTGRAARTVDAAAAAGVLWVNSAGNYGQRHWRGIAAGGGHRHPDRPGRRPRCCSASAGPRPRWPRPWRSSTRTPSGAWTEVQRSAPAGPGNAVTTPLTTDSGAWRLVVRQDAGAPAELSLFSQTVGFGPLAVADGSIPTPGDAAGALSVGAVKWTGVDLEPYSSEGATAGGPAKPDLVAPTYVTSNPEWPGTAGTSSSAAHVAGAAALLRQERQARGAPVAPTDLRAVLVATALDLGRRGADPLYGAGMARLDATAPSLRLGVSRARRPVLRVRVGDEGTIRDVRAILNGRTLRVVRRPAFGLRLPALRGGVNRLTVAAEDMAGNVTTRTRVIRSRAR